MDAEYTDELLDCLKQATQDLHLCPNRLWAVAGESLPRLLPRNLLEESPDNEAARPWTHEAQSSHKLCTFDFCEYAQRDFTGVPQRHECADAACLIVRDRFSRELLEQAAINRTPTAWDLSGRAMLTYPRPYMAISHVWGDGTGPGQWKPGQVNECLFQFFRRIAELLHCEGIWWDTVCIPSEKTARNRAIRNMHHNYLDARVTLVHDCFLRNWLWDPETACFGILMSPWFSRGWTALELANSKNVKIIFRDRNNGLVIKDLDREILSGDDDPDGPRKEATKIINVFRKAFTRNAQSNLNNLLVALGSRHTSWPGDMAIIAALLTGAEPAELQQDTYKRVLQRIQRLLHGHLFHYSVTMAREFTWCPTSLFSMPLQPFRAGMSHLTMSANGDLEGTWRVRKVGDAKDKLMWVHGVHLLIRQHIQNALRKHQHCRLLAEPGSGPVSRALLVSESEVLLQPDQRYCYLYVGALYFREELPGEGWEIRSVVISGAEDPRNDMINSSGSNPPENHASAETPHQMIWRGDLTSIQPVIDSLDLDLPDQLGRRLLHLAAERGDARILETLLHKAASESSLGSLLEAKAYKGQTALHCAAQAGSTAAVRMLLRAGSDAKAEDSLGNRALHDAAQMGFTPVVEMLLSEAGSESVNARGLNGLTALHHAAINGHTDMVSALIQRGANADTRDLFGWTPLHYAAGKGHVDSIVLLTETGQDCSAKDNKIGWTPLHLAAMGGSKAAVDLLLAKGADPETPDLMGWVPQRLANTLGHPVAARSLSASQRGTDTRSGANGQVQWTPFHVLVLNDARLFIQSAATRSCDAFLSEPCNALHFAAENGLATAVQKLLNNGDGGDVVVNVDVRDQRQRTPLSLASERGHELAVQLLLEKGADAHARDLLNCTPVSWAAMNCHAGILERLLDQDAVPDSKTDSTFKEAALSWAAEHGCHDIAQILLERKTNPDYFFQSYGNPLNKAADAGHENMVQLLLNHGASCAAEDFFPSMSSAAKRGFHSVVQVLAIRTIPGARQSKETNITIGINNAIRHGHTAIVRHLLHQRLPVESRIRFGAQFFKQAAEHGREDILRLLLDEGAQVLKARQGVSQTSPAAQSGDDAVIQLLVLSREDVSYSDPKTWLEYSYHCLFLAAEKAHARTVQLLLARGLGMDIFRSQSNLLHDMAHRLPTVYSRPWNGFGGPKDALLQLACIEHEAALQNLLDNVKEVFGDTVKAKPWQAIVDDLLHYAVRESHDAMAIARVLLRNGARASAGLVPALQRGHLQIVRLLMSEGAHHDEAEMLIYAAAHGWYQEAKELLDKGADVNFSSPWRDDFRRWETKFLEKEVRFLKVSPPGSGSPLWWASLMGREEVAELLIEHGANVDHDRDGTPLWWAAFKGHEAVVRLLIDHNASMIQPNHTGGGSPLLAAFCGEDEAILRLLIFENTRTRRAEDHLDFDTRSSSQKVRSENVALMLDEIGHVCDFKMRVPPLEDDNGEIFPSHHVAGQEGSNHLCRQCGTLLIAMNHGWKTITQLLLTTRPCSSFSSPSFHRIVLLFAARYGWEELARRYAHLVDRVTFKAPRFQFSGPSSISLFEPADSTLVKKPPYTTCVAFGFQTGDTALSLSSTNGHAAIVQLLVEKGADIERGAPLFGALRSGHAWIAKYLIHKGAQLGPQPPQRLDSAPLHLAAKAGMEDVARLLIEKGFDVNLNLGTTLTPLHLAAQGNHEAVVRLLLDHGARVHLPEIMHDFSTLQDAAERGNLSVVRLLLDRAPDAPIVCLRALKLALSHKRQATAKLLIEHALANSFKNPTPLGMAAASGVLRDVELVLACGADVNGRGVYDRTALWWAARNGHADVVRLLLDRGADVHAVDHQGRSALWQAARDSREDVVKLLRERGGR